VIAGPVTECQACAAAGLETVIDFLPQPPVQSFLTEQGIREPETHYPVALLRCDNCGLVQLGYAVDPEIVFPKDYPYQTGMTRILIEDFKDLADKAVERYGLGADDLAIDIGSNDGTLLKGFQPHGVRVLGVEPTDIAKIAERNGVPTVQAYFSDDVARQIVAEHGNASVVAATNVIAHMPNLYPFLRGINELLADGGVFVSESHYLLDLVQKLQYDTIYHEHLRFYGLRPLIEILGRAGFTVVDCERVPTHGGSIRVWAVKGEGGAPSERLAAQQREEDEYGLYEPARLEEFRDRIIASKQQLLAILLRLRAEGKRIVGVGAPARSSMLLNYSHIDGDLLDYIVEPPASLKVGLYTPASHIPIVAEPQMLDDQPDYALMLSWHIAEELMPKLRENGFRGGFIVPLPEPRVVEP
jgi:predicted TPR repeat methyltransferase